MLAEIVLPAPEGHSEEHIVQELDKDHRPRSKLQTLQWGAQTIEKGARRDLMSGREASVC